MKAVFNQYRVLFRFLLTGILITGAGGIARAAVLDVNAIAEVVVEEYGRVVDRSVDEAREWMGNQDNPQLQALALIPQRYAGSDIDFEAERLFLHALNRILVAGPDAATLHFLALACESRFLMPQCIKSGMVDALIRIDPYNIATWSIVYQDRPGALLDALEQARYFDTFFPEAVNGWFQALSASTQPITDYTRTVMPVGIVLAIATPALSPLFDACGSAASTNPSSNLAQACRRIADSMSKKGRSLMAQNLGYGLAHRLAEIEQSEEIDVLEHERQAFRSRYICFSKALTGLENDPSEFSAYMERLLNYSELEAMQITAIQQGIDCSTDD